MSGWVQGKSVLVTGSSRGIGASVAAALAGRGASVILTARDRERLERVADGIRHVGGHADMCAVDLATPSGPSRLFEFMDSRGVSLNGFVACAATFRRASVEETSRDLWREVMTINLDAMWECGRRAFAQMKRAGTSDARIVTFGSLSGMPGTEKFPGLAAYNVSKYGVMGLTEALAVEGRDVGISAVCISPGAVDTEMLREAHPTMRARLKPGDVGELVADLLDSSQFPALSGANIPLFSNG